MTRNISNPKHVTNSDSATGYYNASLVARLIAEIRGLTALERCDVLKAVRGKGVKHERD